MSHTINRRKLLLLVDIGQLKQRWDKVLTRTLCVHYEMEIISVIYVYDLLQIQPTFLSGWESKPSSGCSYCQTFC